MKKIFTLLFVAGLTASAQAQSDRDFRDNRTDERITIRQDDDMFDNGARYDNRIAPNRRMAAEIASINREYDFRIQQVKNNFFLNRYARFRKIEQLEDQRQMEIRFVIKKYRRYNHWDDHDNRRRY